MTATMKPMTRKPRQQQNWMAYVRDHATAINYYTVMVACVVFFVVIAMLVMKMARDPQALPVRSIILEGRFENISRADVVEVVEPLAQCGFLACDLGSLRQAVVELPWVYDAGLERVWPDSLKISVTEQAAVARWTGRGFVNRYGDTFFPDHMETGGELPVFVGPDDAAVDMVREYRYLTEQLANLELGVRQFEFDERRAWRVVLSNDMYLLLGRDDQVARLQRFVKSYRRVLASKAATIDHIDLRYPNGFAVAWRSRQEAA
jgi:cell division protein FtsQ